MSREEVVLVVDDSPTILRVAQLVLGKAGYRVVTSRDGEEGLAAAREHRPAVILLDFLMPRINGYQFCRELAREEGLRDLPVVLMSAKGEEVGSRFVRVMRVVDCLQKPFSPESLLAVVEHTLDRYRDGVTAETLLSGPDPDEIARLAHAEAEARARAIDELRQHLAGLAAGAAAGAAAGRRGAPDAGEVRQAVVEAFTDVELEAALARVRAAAPDLGEAAGAALGGDVRFVPIAQVMSLLADQRQTGVLTVARPGARLDVFFRDGLVAFASGAGLSDEFLLGRYVLEEALMTQRDLYDFIRRDASPAQLLGRELVRAGKLAETDLRRVLARQASELVYEGLRWDRGRFVFTPHAELPAVALDAALDLRVDVLLLEGFRRVDEWHLIEREIDDFDAVLVRDDEAIARIGRANLSRHEQTVLDLVNGKNTLRDMVRRSKLSSYDVGRMMYRLLAARLVRRRVDAAVAP